MAVESGVTLVEWELDTVVFGITSLDEVQLITLESI